MAGAMGRSSENETPSLVRWVTRDGALLASRDPSAFGPDHLITRKDLISFSLALGIHAVTYDPRIILMSETTV